MFEHIYVCILFLYIIIELSVRQSTFVCPVIYSKLQPASVSVLWQETQMHLLSLISQSVSQSCILKSFQQ